ncbi:MAG: GNAT family N-acetyltransferase [Methylocystis sp.]
MTLLSSFFAKPTFIIEPIGSERAEECERLHGASFAFGWSKIDFENYLADAHIVADSLIAENRKGELGSFVLSRLTPPDAEVLAFAVDPAYRGVGLGRRILEKHLENLERSGAAWFFWVADDNEPALRLYAREGFKEIGRRENYYHRASGLNAARRSICGWRFNMAPALGRVLRAFCDSQFTSASQRLISYTAYVDRLPSSQDGHERSIRARSSSARPLRGLLEMNPLPHRFAEWASRP